MAQTVSLAVYMYTCTVYTWTCSTILILRVWKIAAFTTWRESAFWHNQSIAYLLILISYIHPDRHPKSLVQLLTDSE